LRHEKFSRRNYCYGNVYLYYVILSYGIGVLMNKKFYEIIYDCIVTGQVSSDRIAKYLKDKSFYKYWQKRKEEEEEIYGQKEQRELNESYKQSLANKKERS